jgi:hypothetical protein
MSRGLDTEGLTDEGERKLKMPRSAAGFAVGILAGWVVRLSISGLSDAPRGLNMT